MMNIIDYLIGNTDRHWGNWGFLVNNANNKLVRLHPLMDYNKAFLSYDTTEGVRCLPRGENYTQKQAALEAVDKIGLNQIKEVKPEWFENDVECRMFFTRLFILKDALGISHPSVDEVVASSR